VLTATACFPNVFFQLQQYSKKHSSFSAYKAALMTKTELIFRAFSLTFVDFAVQFHEKPFESSLTVAWFFLSNHNSLLCIAINEIASFCIDNRLRQMAFFRVCQSGQRPALEYVMLCYVFICLRRLFIYMAANEADVDLRPVNNTQWAETRPQHRELRALLFSISVWVL